MLVCSSPGRSRRCRAASKEVSGGQGKPTAPERWPESSGSGLGDEFLLEAFPCQVWSFSVLLGCVQVARRGDELRPRRSLEVRGSRRLQNGCLRALEETWNNFLLETFSCQVWSFSVLRGRFQVDPGGHELRPRRSPGVRGSLKLQNGGLRALEEAWDNFLLEAFSCQVWSCSALLGLF